MFKKNLGASRLYENCITDIPPEYLNNFLYPGDYLDELSKKIKYERFNK